MITAQVLNVDHVVLALSRIPEHSKETLRTNVSRIALSLRDLVKGGYLTGQVLQVRTGRLRRSITARTTATDYTATGIVGTNVEYARIHEFGGKTKPHEILPIHAKALAFATPGFIGPMPNIQSKGGRYLNGAQARRLMSSAIGRGEIQFAKAVHHPGSRMPMRSFLRAALNLMAPEIKERLEEAIRKAVHL